MVKDANPREYAKSLVEAHPLFQMLPDDSRKNLVGHSSLVTLPPKELLIEENEFNHHLYLLIKGTARVVMNGTEVSRLSAGDIAGEISASGLSTPIANVIAETSLEAIAFPIEAVNDEALEHPAFAEKLREIGMKRVSG
ncbi:MAG: cyclic nucleotide-binding domain-containing protein [Mariprofundaceae bacterium]|nr:cyclic nucleotide-binding domain-containing protein [Mariprofundaceae bacterium]